MDNKQAHILLCVCGGIAAYKVIDLASRLVKAGYSVKTVLTENAGRFVSPMNFAALTHNTVHTSMWEDADPIPHITLADWADLIIVAPATANAIAKAVSGIGDDLISTIFLAHTKPILWVPAMNVNMYQHPATQANIHVLKQRGHHVMEPVTGMLACGYEGKGKYPPNQEVMYSVKTYLNYSQDLQGTKVLVTAGATSEAIDPMRTITNKSSGKMGLALARALALRGASVTLIYANISGDLPYYLDAAVYTPDVESMHKEVLKRARKMDWIVKCAAVSDYKPKLQARHKIKKGEALQLELVRTQDILADLGKAKLPGQKLIGFAAETRDFQAQGLKKLKAKNLDMIVVNDLAHAGSDTNEILLITSQAKQDTPGISGDKFDLAHAIIDRIKSL